MSAMIEPSPAAVRLKNARSAYARLQRAARDPNLDWFDKSLANMLANPPSKTCALHNWHEQIAGYILWQKDAHPTQKIKRLLEVGPPLENASHLVSRCLRVDLPDCALVLCEHGARLDMTDTDATSSLLASLSKGYWPHLEILAPNFFNDPSQTWDMAHELAKYAFEGCYYDAGHGFLSPAHTQRMLSLDTCPATQMQTLYRQIFMLARAPQKDPIDPHPWAESMAMLVESSVLSWEDFSVRVDMAQAVDAARAHFDRRALDRSTVATQPRRAGLGRL